MSSVRVDDEVRTSDERVDIDAESTKTITIAITIGARLEIIVGIMLSNPFIFSVETKSLPKPPRK